MQVTGGKVISLEEFKPLITDPIKEIQKSSVPDIPMEELQRLAFERAHLIPKK